MKKRDYQQLRRIVKNTHKNKVLKQLNPSIMTLQILNNVYQEIALTKENKIKKMILGFERKTDLNKLLNN